MTLLVFGTTGQLGLELQRRVGEDAPFAFLGRDRVDLGDPAACSEAITRLKPGAVINAAAWTDVDGAETAEAAADAINADAPGAMARACAALRIPFVHVSTDYVFDGTGADPWRPDDPTSPQNAYGRTKLAGEDAIRAAGGPHAILRTSWVISPHGKNFAKTMLRLGAERDRISVVADQVGAPTPAWDLAGACLTAAECLIENRSLSGTYHYQGQPWGSWADVAREVFRQASLECIVEDIDTSAFPTPASRPLNSRLDCTLTEAAFGLRLPDWRVGLSHIIAAWRATL
ncbi:MAG: dTDP-4-dehydrorhamnose reductase [Pseudomonadota bacterium]